MEHRITIPLRWRDMDMLGHLNQLLGSASPGDAEGVAAVAEAAGLRVELGRSRDGGRTLDVIEPAA